MSSPRPFDEHARECREALERGDVDGAQAALAAMKSAQAEDVAELDALYRTLERPWHAADTTRGDSDG